MYVCRWKLFRQGAGFMFNLSTRYVQGMYAPKTEMISVYVCMNVNYHFSTWQWFLYILDLSTRYVCMHAQPEKIISVYVCLYVDWNYFDPSLI